LGDWVHVGQLGVGYGDATPLALGSKGLGYQAVSGEARSVENQQGGPPALFVFDLAYQALEFGSVLVFAGLHDIGKLARDSFISSVCEVF
jgi:hypothetical protein